MTTEIKEEKESKLKKASKAYQTLQKIWFILFNMAYIIAYSVFTGFSLVNKNQQVPWLPYVLGGFILVFLGVFIATLVQGSKEQVKSIKKDYKGSFKVIKKLLKLVNLAVTITIVTGTVMSDTKNIFELVLMGVSIAYTALQIIMEIVKFVKRKKKEKKKAQKQAEKAEKKEKRTKQIDTIKNRLQIKNTEQENNENK